MLQATSVEATYEATVSTGLEGIAKDEVKEKLHVDAVVQKGRVLFTTDRKVRDILRLKSISNLFIIIYDENLKDEDIPNDGSCLESLLMKVGEKCCWQTGISKWQEMSEFDCKLDDIMTKDSELRVKQPKFRVSSNRYGPKHQFTSPEICSVFGHVIDTLFGWPIKMKDYDLEVMCNFNVNHLYVAITLSPKSLDRRHIVETGLTTLKAATCYALLRVAKIQTGDIVVDPMAGSGAIPVECCASWNDEWFAYTLGGELKDVPLAKSRVNLNIFQDNRPPSDLLKLDVTCLPFRQDSIDVFVSDLPFGRRHGSKRVNRTLYPALLTEMARVSRVKSGRAVLLTQDLKSMNVASDKNRDYWFQKMCQFVKIGNLSCYIYLFLRTSNCFLINKDNITVDAV